MVKHSIRSPSSLEHKFEFRKSVTIFAPIGYPLISPIIKAYADSPGTLNNGFMILLNALLM